MPATPRSDATLHALISSRLAPSDHWHQEAHQRQAPLCVARARTAAALAGQQPVRGSWIPTPSRRPHYLLPVSPKVKWMIPCRTADYGGQARSGRATAIRPSYAIELVGGSPGGNASAPWRDWGDPPPPRVPPRTQWEWRHHETGCALLTATRERFCRVLASRQTNVLFVGDSRQRIMAYSLYKMLGGEGLFDRHELDCCRHLDEPCCLRLQVCAKENGGKPCAAHVEHPALLPSMPRASLTLSLCWPAAFTSCF